MAVAPLRIVVSDDSPSYRRTICSILQQKPNLQIIAEVECGLAVIEAVKKHRADVVLIGNSISFFDCVKATSIIKTKFPEVRVILLSEADGISSLREAYQAGAFWCLKRRCSSKEILRTIRAAES